MQDPVVGAAALAPRSGLNDPITLQNPWSGAGSNRRPSAFQEPYRPFGVKRGKFLLPCSSASPLVSRVLSHSIDRTGVCRRVPFRPWDSCGDHRQNAELWGFCGAGRMRMLSPAPRVTPTAEVRSITHRDDGRGQVRPYRCRLGSPQRCAGQVCGRAQIRQFGAAFCPHCAIACTRCLGSSGLARRRLRARPGAACWMSSGVC